MNLDLDALNLPPCPPHLEDEYLLIATAGEMPEVALAESLLHIPPPSPAELDCLRGAVVRGYLNIITRDLDPASVGGSGFRGLERALANWRRLEGFLARLGWPLPPGLRRARAGELTAYLKGEAAALEAGRAYASADPAAARELARELGLELAPWEPLLGAMARLPWLDFLGLRALARLEGVAAAAKRMRPVGDKVALELTDRQGRRLAGAALPLASASPLVQAENRARLERVWSLIRVGCASGRPRPS